MMLPRWDLDPEEGLLVEWPDAHQSRYTFAYLREICPCAGCRDERRPEPGARPSGPRSAISERLVRCDPVGNYAVGITWADGHNAGIYSWEYLRDHCRCLGCRVRGGMEV